MLKEAHGVARAESRKAQENEGQLRHQLQACVLVSDCSTIACRRERACTTPCVEGVHMCV